MRALLSKVCVLFVAFYFHLFYCFDHDQARSYLVISRMHRSGRLELHGPTYFAPLIGTRMFCSHTPVPNEYACGMRVNTRLL